MKKIRFAVAAVSLLAMLGATQIVAADEPLDTVCALLTQVGIQLDQLDCDGDGFTPAQGDCNDADAATYPGAPDDPDLAYVDSNCDGIDGDASRAIFVSPGGNDGSAGTTLNPKRTLEAGIAAAASNGFDVYVREGVFDVPDGVELVPGVSIFGRFTAGWNRPGDATVIQGDTQAMLADGVTDVVLQLLELRTLDLAAAQGGSSYGLRALSSSLRLEALTIEAGDALDGGVAGSSAPGPAAPGGNGLPGSCDSNVNASGGSGGLSPVGRHGGTGGSGRYAAAGLSGAAGFGPGGGGGNGGNAGDPGAPGQNGFPGAHGIDGAHGAGGAAGPALIGEHWVGQSGVPGADGQHGGGGGGGGAGGGQIGFFVINGTGNGGGGGGAGGRGGFGGAGGAPGVGSFGLYLLDSSVEIAHSTTIAAGRGGRGWAGTPGHGGQQGGAGGLGAAACLSEVGRGGHGGSGGNGGRGGAGGGGAGGPSIGIYLGGTSTADLTGSPQPTHDQGGPGGASDGGAAFSGAPGIAAAFYP